MRLFGGYKDIGSRAVQYFKRKHDVILTYIKKLIVEYLIYKDSNCLKVQCKRFGSYFDEMVILHIDG